MKGQVLWNTFPKALDGVDFSSYLNGNPVVSVPLSIKGNAVLALSLSLKSKLSLSLDMPLQRMTWTWPVLTGSEVGWMINKLHISLL